MSEMEKREEKLRTALGFEKQRVNELEKALREMRSEHAEMKFTADSKLEEAHALSTSIEGRSLEVEAKLRAVDARLAEISKKTSEIIRKSSEIEAKESSLMRERMSFYNERDAHEWNLSNQREDLRVWERKLQEGEEKLAEVCRLLNQREELANDSDRLFKQKQLDLEEARKRIDVANSELKSKEDDIITRMGNLALKEKEAAVISKNLQVREKELLELEEKLNAREQFTRHLFSTGGSTKNYAIRELAQLLEIDPVADVRGNRASKSKPKEQHEMMQTTTTKWFDLPLDLQVNILCRVVAVEKLWNVPQVCQDWRKICKEPSMWRVIYIDSYLKSDCWPYPWPSGLPDTEITARKMCKNAVDRSQGQLVDITMVGFCDDELLEYVVDRSPKLRILGIPYPYCSGGSVNKALKKLPKLEELSIYCDALSESLKDLELGSYCPELKTLGLNNCSGDIHDEEIIAISENLRELGHLEIHMNDLSNTGLQAILDGCPSLEVLDLRLCPFVDLKGLSGKRLEQIKCVLHAEPVDTDPYNLYDESLMDLKTWRKIVVDGRVTASMSDSSMSDSVCQILIKETKVKRGEKTCAYYLDQYIAAIFCNLAEN